MSPGANRAGTGGQEAVSHGSHEDAASGKGLPSEAPRGGKAQGAWQDGPVGSGAELRPPPPPPQADTALPPTLLAQALGRHESFLHGSRHGVVGSAPPGHAVGVCSHTGRHASRHLPGRRHCSSRVRFSCLSSKSANKSEK